MASAFAWSRSMFLIAITHLIFFSRIVQGKVDSLFTSSVTYCSPPEAILIQEFSIIYFAANESVSFNISAASVQPNLRVEANIFLNVYGMKPINVTEDFCEVFGQALCPLPTYNFTGSAAIPLPSSIKIASKVPNIAYKIPDLEAFAQLTLTDKNTGKVAACIQATLSNGWSTRQPAVSYATGSFTIFALVSGLLHSLLPSTPFAPSSSSLLSVAPSRFVDLVLLFQQIALTGFLHLNFPLVYRAFVANFAWSLGLFPKSRQIQNAIDRMRHMTGGSFQDGVQSPIAFVDRQLSPYNVAPTPGSSFLSQANAMFMASNRALITVRDATTDSSANAGPPATVTSNDRDILPAGLPVYVNSLDIGTTNAFMSVFFTVLIGVVLGAGILAIMHILLTYVVTRAKGNKWAWADVIHAELPWFAASNGIRYALVILYPVLVLTFFQWTLHDSWLATFLSVITLLCTSAAILYPAVRTILIVRRSSYGMLYTTPSYIRTLGALYFPFRESRYFFFAVPLMAALLKSAFISFAKVHGLVQATAILVIELAVLISTCLMTPHRMRSGNVLSIYLAVTRTASAGLMIPFVESLLIKPIPRVAVGFVLMVIFSIAIVVMFVNVIYNFGMGLLWKRHGNNPLRSSDSSSSDVEKGEDTKEAASRFPIDSTIRPGNPTPSTSFSRDVASHSRHTPHMDAAISPNFTIPTFYSADEESERDGQSSPPYSTRTRHSSYFTVSPPSTGRDTQFPSPIATKAEYMPTHQEHIDS
ncbi:hypothetical protein BU17DRAFT_70012 [Hysterangium stoloniferum]|nr:hypothetical protein BU17DRAFT_70012 [Hysterangium stoloniferum]